MTYEDDLRRWPRDATEGLAFQLIRAFVAVDAMLREVGVEGWSADMVADELMRRLHRRLQHMAEEFSVIDVERAATLVAEAATRIGLGDDWLDAAPTFRR